MASRIRVLAVVLGLMGSLPVQGKPPDVKFVPTPQEVVDFMLKLAHVRKGELVCDLGCGDGRILVTAARKYGARGLGFDIDPRRYREALANVKANGVEHLVKIVFGDIFKVDFHDADVVTLYLGEQLNQRLLPQLRKLKPGSRIVSYDYDIEGVKSHRFGVKCRDGVTRFVFLWFTPLDEPARVVEPPGSGRKPAPAAPAPAAPAGARGARIWVWVPEDAVLWFDDARTTSTGRLRYFESPPLAAGKRYRYTLQARWRARGHTVTETQTLRLRAGDDAVVTFPTPVWLKELSTDRPAPPPVVKPAPRLP